MDISDFVPIIAQHLGLTPSTLLFLLAVIHLAAKYGARVIPDDATGTWAVLRNICATIGIEKSSTLTSDGTTMKDVTRAALATPPITQKAEEIAKGGGEA